MGERVKYICTAGTLTIVLIIAMSMMASTGATGNVPSIFLNDEPFKFHNEYPIQIYDGEVYVPVMVFEQYFFNDSVVNYEGKTLFYIQRNNRDFISVDVNNSSAITLYESDISCKIYQHNRANYISAELVSRVLGFEMEYNEQYNTVRIQNTSSRKKFEELINGYTERQTTTEMPTTVQFTTEEPSESTVEPVTEPPPTEPMTKKPSQPGVKPTPPPPTTEEPTEPPPTEPPEITDPINNYFLADGSFIDGENPESTERLAEIVDYMGEMGITARIMFVLSVEEIQKSPEPVAFIRATGHETAVLLEERASYSSAKSVEEMLNELNGINNFFYGKLKRKTAFYRFGGAVDLTMEKSIAAYELRKHGYFEVGETLTTGDFAKFSEIGETVEFLKRNRANVIMLDYEGYRKCVEDVKRASDEKFYINISYLNAANAVKKE